ncbi:Facilitated trehalose transporter Tret1, partial [Stegodyphus mimosarum]
MFTSIPYLAGWLMIAYATSVEWIYVGRALTGFCAGIGAVTAPAYLVEISTTETRGLLTTSFQIAAFLDILMINSLGLVLRWSFLAVLGAVVITIAMCLTYFVPESPHWLIRQSRNLEGMEALMFLRGKHSNVNREFREISDSQADQPADGIRLRDLLDPTFYKPLLLAVSLMFFQQFCGTSVVLSYAVEIFQSTGSLINPYVCASVVAAVQLFAGAISSVLMDKVGRKMLYITSGSFIMLSLIVLGIHSFASEKNNIHISSFQWVPLVCFVSYIAAYSIEYGPIPGVVIPEIVPIYSRSTVLYRCICFVLFFWFCCSKMFR